jgi:hypothetical protein
MYKSTKPSENVYQIKKLVFSIIITKLLEIAGLLYMLASFKFQKII